jgi:hypothetical protein
MKRIILILMVVFANNFLAEAQEISLPKECGQILDKKYKGWKMADIPLMILNWHKNSKQPFNPNLIKGDWDGDGKMDYAALIEKGKLRSPNGMNAPTLYTVAFIKRANSYSFYKLDENSDFIGLAKKGDKGYDYETGKTFTYKNDAIFSGIFEKAGTSFIWRKGKFVGIATSD